MDNKQIRCKKCNKLLGEIDHEFNFCVPINSANCELGKTIIKLKCPRCDTFNSIEIKI